MSQALLMLAHKPPFHLAKLATLYPEANFYLHYDAKADIKELQFLRAYPNVFIVPERINIHWAGFSMIQATLILFQAALNHSQNQFFHLISGDCALLQSIYTLEQATNRLPENTILIETNIQPQLNYRPRFSAWHADTKYQRRLIGKIFTKALKYTDKLFPTSTTYFSGSQWFSGSRYAINLLLENSPEWTNFFSKKLCPDEHFFQTIAKQHQDKLNIINNNQRYIEFSTNTNHPKWLSFEQLQQAQQQGLWFARKATSKQIEQLLLTQQSS